jgi:hypothetical protein
MGHVATQEEPRQDERDHQAKVNMPVAQSRLAKRTWWLLRGCDWSILRLGHPFVVADYLGRYPKEKGQEKGGMIVGGNALLEIII